MISLRNVSLEFPIKRMAFDDEGGSVGGKIVRRGHKFFVEAIDNISFQVDQGDRVALLGGNGSGKSTLLRLCAGIYVPTSGSLQASGSISTLFTSSIGLNGRHTGKKNIELGLKLLGVSKKEIPEVQQRIAQFSELGRYLDLPLNTYSAGMRARLGFSIVTSIRPDILLIDEVFGAGDALFVEKARQRLADVAESASILMMASHSLVVLGRFCNKALWLDRGQTKMFGGIEEVLSEYREQMNSG